MTREQQLQEDVSRWEQALALAQCAMEAARDEVEWTEGQLANARENLADFLQQQEAQA